MIVFYVIVGASLWILMPIFYGVPWRPTQKDRIRRALRLAGLKPNEIIYDLGADDGRVLILAAREFGARGVVTISFDIPGWQPSAFDRDMLIFLYEMPPVRSDRDTFLDSLK